MCHVCQFRYSALFLSVTLSTIWFSIFFYHYCLTTCCFLFPIQLLPRVSLELVLVSLRMSLVTFSPQKSEYRFWHLLYVTFIGLCFLTSGTIANRQSLTQTARIKCNSSCINLRGHCRVFSFCTVTTWHMGDIFQSTLHSPVKISLYLYLLLETLSRGWLISWRCTVSSMLPMPMRWESLP